MISNPISIAGIYLRLSNEDDRDGESFSITNQRALLVKYAKEKNIRIYNEYIDDGYSGTSFDRPAFKKLLEDASRGKINTIITKDMSRLGREHIETCYYIEKYFPENNIRYISVLDQLDTSIENGISDVTPFKAVLNDMYAKDISKKVRSIKRNRAEEGYYMGTYTPYGYKKSPENKNKLIIDEEVVDIVRRIFKMASAGKSPMQISYILNREGIPIPSKKVGNVHTCTTRKMRGLWNPSVIRRMLQNELYLGNMVQGKVTKLNYKSKKMVQIPRENWIIVENTHEPIIDKETFELVKNQIERRKGIRNKTYDWKLKGLLCCKECGKKLSVVPANMKKSKQLYIRCNTYASAPKERLCTPHTNNLDKITDIIIEKIKETCKKYIDHIEIQNIANEKKNIIEKSINSANNNEELKKQIKIINEKIDKIYDDNLSGKIADNDFERIYNKYVNQKNEIEEKLKKIICSEEKKIDKEFINRKVKEFIEMKEITNEMLVQLIEKIEISQDKEITIHYKFNIE